MPTGKPTASARQRAQGDVGAALDERHAEAGQRAELRPDDHRADDQDRLSRAIMPTEAIRQARTMKARKLALSSMFSEVRASTSSQTTASPRRARAPPARPGRPRRRAASRSARARSSRRRGCRARCRSSITTLASSRATSQRITSPRRLARGAPRSEDQVGDRRARFEQVEDAARTWSRGRRSAGGPWPQRIRARRRLGSAVAMLTDYHLHLRPDEPDTPPERYFTAENVERYLAGGGGGRDRGAGRLRARLPLHARRSSSGATPSGRNRRATTSTPTASSCADAG